MKFIIKLIESLTGQIDNKEVDNFCDKISQEFMEKIFKQSSSEDEAFAQYAKAVFDEEIVPSLDYIDFY